MKKIAIITTAFGYGLEDRKNTYENVFNEYNLEPWYCTKDELLESPESIEGVIVGVEQADETLFKTCRDLKIALKFGVGMDNFDAKSAALYGVTISNLPGINSDAVAEMTFALLLAVSRRIHELHMSCVRGEFLQLCSHSILNKTIGIVGLGSIGKKVAKFAQAFSMRCIGYDVVVQEAQGIECVDFDTLVSKSDIVTIHVPLTRENYHLFNEKVFSKMKKGSILINTSRGGIVDESALAMYLSNGHLGGAGLDVFESKSSVSAVIDSSLAVCTSHVAAYTHETLRHMEHRIIEKMATMIFNEPL